MRFPGNCVLVAFAAWSVHPRNTRIKVTRNRAGRFHIYWERDGRRFEFYTPGASNCSYLRNLVRVGSIREIKRLA